LSSWDEYFCVTHNTLTTVLSCLLMGLPCDFKALLVAMAPLIALAVFVSQVLWRLSTRMASIVP
jgi:hypothetical protein